MISSDFEFDPERALWRPGRRSFLFMLGAAAVGLALPARLTEAGRVFCGDAALPLMRVTGIAWDGARVVEMIAPTSPAYRALWEGGIPATSGRGPTHIPRPPDAWKYEPATDPRRHPKMASLPDAVLGDTILFRKITKIERLT